MFLSQPGNVVPVHPNTIEYAKKLLDELSASKPATEERGKYCRNHQLKTLPKKVFLHQKMEVKLTVKVMMWNPLAQITKAAALLSEENRN